MAQRFGLFASVLSFGVLAGSFGALAYTDAEVSKAKEFIASKLPADKKALLEDLAKKSGKPLEVMFLDIAKLTGDETLGVHGGRPEDPDPPTGNSSSSDNTNTNSESDNSGK